MSKKNVKIVILVENTTYKEGIYAEHGLSIYIEKENSKLLFDTGQTDLLLRNAEKLGIGLKDLDEIFLSHGHYDHTGGLPSLPAQGTAVYAHPDIFLPRYVKRNDGKVSNIGMPFRKQDLEEYGYIFHLNKKSDSFRDFIFTGEIPRANDFESTKTNSYKDSKLTVRDEIIDDQSLFFQTDKGIVVLLGCSHSGIINTLHHIQKQTGEKKFYWIIGGTHLIKAGEQRLGWTVDELKKIKFQYISPLHCTGIKAVSIFQSAFEEKLYNLTCGDVISI